MDEEEEGKKRGFRVVDRRRFTADGGTRPGASKTEDSKPASAPQVLTREGRSSDSTRPAPEPAPAAPTATAPTTRPPTKTEPEPEGSVDFLSFVASLATSAMGALGALPPGYGPPGPVNPELAREYIEIIAMLKNKTLGNLSSQEDQAMKRLLSDLRMAFVEFSKRGGEPTNG